jgi:hypothetical protein
MSQCNPKDLALPTWPPFNPACLGSLLKNKGHIVGCPEKLARKGCVRRGLPADRAVAFVLILISVPDPPADTTTSDQEESAS